MPFFNFLTYRRRRRSLTIGHPTDGKRLSYSLPVDGKRLSHTYRFSNSTAETTQSSFDFSDSDDDLPKRIMSPFHLNRASTGESSASGKKLRKEKTKQPRNNFWWTRRRRNTPKPLGVNEGFEGFDFGFGKKEEDGDGWAEEEEEEEEEDERFLASPPNVLIMGGRMGFDDSDDEDEGREAERRKREGAKQNWRDGFAGQQRVLMTGI